MDVELIKLTRIKSIKSKLKRMRSNGVQTESNIWLTHQI